MTGDNGILTKAQEAKTKTEEAQKQEEAQLKDLEDYINGVVVSEEGYDEKTGVNALNCLRSGRKLEYTA